MTRQFDEELKKLEGVIEDLRRDAEGEVEKFFAVLGSSIEAWLPGKVREYVTTQAAITRALQESQVAELKRSIGAFAKNAEIHSRSWIGHDRYWQHRVGHDAATSGAHVGGYETSHFDSGYENPPGRLGEALQEALNGELRDILTPYGYKVPQERRNWPFRVPWKKDLLSSYSKSLVKLQQARSERDKVRREKEIFEATSLWDKA